MDRKFNFVIFLILFLGITTIGFAQEDKPAKVRGRVSNYFGFPLEKIEVKFFLLKMKSGEYVSAEGQFIKSAFTNELGLYEVSELPWGEYRVSTNGSGFPKMEVWRFYLWSNAERTLDLGLKAGIIHGFPELKVFGTVTLNNGEAVDDVTITLINAFDGTEAKQAKTDKNGKYQIEFIQPGQYIIYASKPDFSVAASSFVINGIGGANYPQTEINKKVDMKLLLLSISNTKK